MKSPSTFCPLQSAIERACTASAPFTARRTTALAEVRWVLASDDGRFVSVDSRGFAGLTDAAAEATVYDGRDNERLKVAFFEALLKVSLSAVLLD